MQLPLISISILDKTISPFLVARGTRGQEILREKILRGQEKVNQVYFEPGKVESLKKRQRKLEF